MLRPIYRFVSILGVLAFSMILCGMASAEPFKVSERTPIKLCLLETLISGTNKVGEAVHFEVREDIKAPNGKILVACGAKALGKITLSKKRGILCKAGKLEVALESVEATDGTRIPLRAVIEKKGKSNKGAAVATVISLPLLFGFVSSRDSAVKEGTELIAYVDQDTMVDPSKLLGSQTVPPATSSAVAPDAKFDVLSSMASGSNVLGEIQNMGPLEACPELIVLICKGGEPVGSGKIILPKMGVNEKSSFSVPIHGSTDGVIAINVNSKAQADETAPAK